jgi:hypothetical protein
VNQRVNKISLSPSDHSEKEHGPRLHFCQITVYKNFTERTSDINRDKQVVSYVKMTTLINCDNRETGLLEYILALISFHEIFLFPSNSCLSILKCLTYIKWWSYSRNFVFCFTFRTSLPIATTLRSFWKQHIIAFVTHN